MNRRDFLFATGAVGVTGLSGCLAGANVGDDADDGTQTDDSSTDETTVDGDEPELAPGSQATLIVEARNVIGLHFSDLPAGEAIDFDVNRATLTPRPDVTAESYPPLWSWSSRTDVTVELPISVVSDATPGEYSYGVTVRGDESTEITETFLITVVED